MLRPNVAEIKLMVFGVDCLRTCLEIWADRK